MILAPVPRTAFVRGFLWHTLEGMAMGVQITPDAIRATVDAVLADVGEFSSTRAVAVIAADRLCVASGRQVGGDELADLEAACLAVLSEEE